jgi:choloylglycine hydrolase
MRPSTRTLAWLAVALLLPLGARPGGACTTFCSATADGGVRFGRNYDWDIGHAFLMVNARGLAKQGFDERGPRWSSTYGSVTFNQYGREFPTGGMNERGLVVEVMWLDQTVYPAPDDRAALGVLEWIQYQLDTAATVDEVLASDARVRIAGDVPLHYLVADASGAAATVEFLAGKLVAHRGASLPVAALANSTYEESLRFWQAQSNDRGPGGAASLARFARAASQARALSSLDGERATVRAFAILGDVADPATRWSIVYDPTRRVVRYRTALNPAIRVLHLGDQELSCRRPARAVDIDAGAGDVAPLLVEASAALNRALVRTNYPASRVTRSLPPAELVRIADHPEHAFCRTP